MSSQPIVAPAQSSVSFPTILVRMLAPLRGVADPATAPRAAFIDFELPVHAEQAMGKQNSELAGLPITIEPGRRSPRRLAPTTAILRNLPADTTEAMVKPLFQGLNVVRTELMPPRPPTNPGSAIIVEFGSTADLNRALALKDTSFRGQPLDISQARARRDPNAPRTPRAPRPQRAPRAAPATTAAGAALRQQLPPLPPENGVIIHNVVPPVDKATLQAALSAFGTVTLLSARRGPRSSNLRSFRVQFDKPEAAQAALRTGTFTLPGLSELQAQEQAQHPIEIVPVPIRAEPAAAPASAAAVAAPGAAATTGRRRRRGRGGRGVAAAAAPATAAGIPIESLPSGTGVPVGVPAGGRRRRGEAAATGIPAAVAPIAAMPKLPARLDLMRLLAASKHPAHIMLKRILYEQRETSPSPSNVWTIVKKSQEEKTTLGLLDLGRYVAVVNEWSWDGGCHISAIANTISMLHARNIEAHGMLVLIGASMMTQEVAMAAAQIVEQNLSANLLPVEACRVRVQHISPAPSEGADTTATGQPGQWFVSVEILPQDTVVTFGGSVMLWDPLCMRTAEVHSPAEIAVLQAEIASPRRRFEAAGKPLACAGLGDNPILVPGQPGKASALSQAVLRDLADIDVSLLRRFLSELPVLRAELASRDTPAHVARGSCDGRCGPRFEESLLQLLGVEGAAAAPEQPVTAKQFACLQGLPGDVIVSDVQALFPAAGLTEESVILTRVNVDETNPTLSVRIAFVDFGSPAKCEEALKAYPPTAAPAPAGPAAPATVDVRGRRVIIEPARQVPRSRRPRRPRRPRVQASTERDVQVALVLESLGLWPHEAAKILFGKHPTVDIKVTIADPNSETPNYTRVAELLSIEFIESLQHCMGDICPEPLKAHEGALPRSALIEALVNAIAHTDYSVHRPVISIHISGDAVVIRNDIESSQQALFAHQNVMRSLPHTVNPVLTDFFVRCGLMNGLGIGRQQMYMSALRTGAPLPKAEVSPSHLPIRVAATPLPPQSRLTWTTTLWTGPAVAPGEISAFDAITKRLHEHAPDTQDSLLTDSTALVCAELAAEPLRARHEQPITPATPKPAPRPLNQVIPIVGMFFQRDIESMAQRLGEASPFTIEPVEEQSEQVPVVELSDWAWAIIRDFYAQL